MGVSIFGGLEGVGVGEGEGEGVGVGVRKAFLHHAGKKDGKGIQVQYRKKRTSSRRMGANRMRSATSANTPMLR